MTDKAQQDEVQAEMNDLDPKKSSSTGLTESGELERPQLFSRKIDCGGNPEVTDRHQAARGATARPRIDRTSRR
jgi:hypothetical protein